jgi:hypothetical protein
MSLRRSMLFSLGGALPLDSVYSTALFAYGLRKLRNAYTGACLRVRNSVGALGDLAFDSNGEVSTSSIVTITTAGTGFTLSSTHTLSAFANGGNVTVHTWYDQSTRNRHITQSTVSSQPFLMQNGNFRLVDGKPSIFFPNILGRLQYTGACADYYNLVNNLGSLTIVKYVSTSVNFPTNQISLYGVANFTTDSSSVSPTNCTTYTAFHAFGIPNQQASSSWLGFGSRTFPNYAESCGSSFPACAAHPIIGIGASISNTNIHDGSAGRIISITDRNANRTMSTYVNGSLDFTRNYQCSLIRFPIVDRVSPTSTTNLSFFFIGNPNPRGYDNNGNLATCGGDEIDYSFQEFIAFDGTYNHIERSVIEQNMGRYYNITV